MDDLDTMLGQYVRAQLLLSFFAFVAYSTFFLIVRLPYALAVAAIGGVLEFIPFVGPLVTLAILVGIAFLTGYPHMGKDLDLHPLLAIFAILVGGEIGGVVGIYLSIPAVAAVRILWMNWTRRISVRKK